MISRDTTAIGKTHRGLFCHVNKTRDRKKRTDIRLHKFIRAPGFVCLSAPLYTTSILRSSHGLEWLLELQLLLPHSLLQERGGTKWHTLLKVPPNTCAYIPLAGTYSCDHTSLKGGWETKLFSWQITCLKKKMEKMKLKRPSGGPATKGYQEPQRARGKLEKQSECWAGPRALLGTRQKKRSGKVLAVLPHTTRNLFLQQLYLPTTCFELSDGCIQMAGLGHMTAPWLPEGGEEETLSVSLVGGGVLSAYGESHDVGRGLV